MSALSLEDQARYEKIAERIKMDAWLRVNDPARLAARDKGVFFVKTYYGESGCIANREFSTSTEALDFIRYDLTGWGPDDELSYRYFANDGEEVELQLTWIPKVVCV